MNAKLISVVKFYDGYTIGYIRYGNINIWATHGTINDAMYQLTSKVTELKTKFNFY